jgi:hypothetical protein
VPVHLPSAPVICSSVVHQKLAHATLSLDTLTLYLLFFFFFFFLYTFPKIFSLQLPPGHNVLLQIVMFFFQS